jgi:hypothetical protein
MYFTTNYLQRIVLYCTFAILFGLGSPGKMLKANRIFVKCKKCFCATSYSHYYDCKRKQKSIFSRHCCYIWNQIKVDQKRQQQGHTVNYKLWIVRQKTFPPKLINV